MSEPQTPEEQYGQWRDIWAADLAIMADVPESLPVARMVYCLRAMIASLDAEINRLTETVNRQDTDIATLISDNKHLARQIASRNPTAQDTVAVPRALVAALDHYMDGYINGATDFEFVEARLNLTDAYNTWKAGQTR